MVMIDDGEDLLGTTWKVKSTGVVLFFVTRQPDGWLVALRKGGNDVLKYDVLSVRNWIQRGVLVAWTHE
jgi:hypothetical protein